MSTTPPALRNLARRLLAGEPGRVESPTGDLYQAVRACDQLRAPLTKLIGAGGFSSLLSRALSLARRQAPALVALRVESDGSLAGLDAVLQDAGANEAPQGGEVLVGELLGLLVTFIGEPLMLSLVREAWPTGSIRSI